MAADEAHGEPRAGAGIAEVEHRLRLQEPADAETGDRPGALAGAGDGGAERPHGGAGAEHVVGLEQPLDGGLAHRHGAEHQRAVRDRLVAGHADAADERTVGSGGERGGGSGVGHRRATILAGKREEAPPITDGTTPSPRAAPAGSGSPGGVDEGIGEGAASIRY